MSNSLRDQLIKAGVVTQEQADKAQAEQKAQQKAERDARRSRHKAGSSGRKDGRADTRGKKGEARHADGKRSDGKRGDGKKGDGRRGRAGGRNPAGRQRRDAAPQDDSPEAVKARAAAQAFARDQRAVKALKRAAEGSEKALRDELRRFIAAYDQRAKEPLDSDEPYHFAHNKKIKRIYLPVEQIDALSQGALVVINHDGRYALLPFGPACAVASVEPRRIIAAHLAADDEPAAVAEAEETEGDAVATDAPATAEVSPGELEEPAAPSAD